MQVIVPEKPHCGGNNELHMYVKLITLLSSFSASVTSSEKLNCLKDSLVWRMFWPGPSSVCFNTRLRELFGNTWNAACLSRDDPSQVSERVVKITKRFLSPLL